MPKGKISLDWDECFLEWSFAAAFVCFGLRREHEDCMKMGESKVESGYEMVIVMCSLEGGHA